MTSIAKQNTIDALYVMHQPEAKKWGVRVIDGNVRIATWTDRLGSFINNFRNPNRTRTDWNEKAKEAISNKLCNEITSFQKETNEDSIKKRVDLLLTNINKIKKEEILNSAKTIIFESKDLAPKPKDEAGFEEISLNDAFDNETICDSKTKQYIEKLWKIKDKKTYNSLIEELTESNEMKLKDAIDIAETTIYLMKNHSLPRSVALNDAKDLSKFSNTLLIAKKIEESPDQIEIAYYTKKFMENKGLSTSDSVLCAKSLKGIKAEKKIKTPAAIEIAVTRLNKMKEFQKVTPRGLPLNIDGTATVFKLDFSSEGKKTIINSVKKPQLEKIDSNGVNSAFTRDSNRQKIKFKYEDKENLFNDHSIIKNTIQNNKILSQIQIDENEEKEKKDDQEALINELKKFSNDDEEIYYALSLVCDQGVGISFNKALFTDFNPKINSIHFFGIDPDIAANKNNLKTNSLITIQSKENGNIRINFELKQKINYISNEERAIIMPIKNSDKDFEIEGEYSVEYKLDTLRKMTLQAKKILENNPSSEELKKVTLNPDVELISTNIFMKFTPDWELEI
jgi:hypothetical protein